MCVRSVFRLTSSSVAIVVGRPAVGQQLKDLELARGQPVESLIDVVVARAEPAEPPERELDLVVRVQRLASVRCADGVGQVLDGCGLAEEPVCSRLDRPSERQLVVRAGEDDHGGLLRDGADPPGRLEPVDAGHLEVDQHDVGLPRLGRVGGALAVDGDHDHVEVVFLVERHASASPNARWSSTMTTEMRRCVGIHRSQS